MEVALITGVTGQDGSYMAELLLEKKYFVVGLYRRSSTANFERIAHLLNHPFFELEEFDLTDPSGVSQIISKWQPNEFYNLAAQSHVGTSFKQPTTTFEINAVGVINILEAIRSFSSHTRLYQAGTSEMFGRSYTIGENGEKYQNENTPMLPQSPYGIAKLASYHTIQIYRAAYNLHCCCGILFNHESPRRGDNFVTRKITKYIGHLVNNRLSKNDNYSDSGYRLGLGNLDAQRDWGHAKDYVRAMYMMLQQYKPKDYVISTGSTRTVREFCELAFKKVGLNYIDHIYTDQKYYRPAEVDYLLGDSSLARKELGWEPSITFEQLVDDMVSSDIKFFQ